MLDAALSQRIGAWVVVQWRRRAPRNTTARRRLVKWVQNRRPRPDLRGGFVLGPVSRVCWSESRFYRRRRRARRGEGLIGWADTTGVARTRGRCRDGRARAWPAAGRQAPFPDWGQPRESATPALDGSWGVGDDGREGRRGAPRGLAPATRSSPTPASPLPRTPGSPTRDTFLQSQKRNAMTTIQSGVYDIVTHRAGRYLIASALKERSTSQEHFIDSGPAARRADDGRSPTRPAGRGDGRAGVWMRPHLGVGVRGEGQGPRHRPSDTSGCTHWCWRPSRC